jgi:hypothetical protein
MLLFSPNWLFLYPGILMMLTGAVLGGGLLARPLDVAGVRLSVGTLIYCVTLIEVGFQAAWFALLSRAYPVQEGLVPQSARMRVLDRLVTLESGLLAGSGLVAVGFGLFFYAVSLWSGARFGALDVDEIARICIASSLAISLGFEVGLSSLLLSTLKLNVRSLPGLDA